MSKIEDIFSPIYGKPSWQVQRGHGLDGRRDGIVYKSVLATYSHVHALGAPDWARAFVGAALTFQGRSSSERGR